MKLFRHSSTIILPLASLFFVFAFFSFGYREKTNIAFTASPEIADTVKKPVKKAPVKKPLTAAQKKKLADSLKKAAAVKPVVVTKPVVTTPVVKPVTPDLKTPEPVKPVVTPVKPEPVKPVVVETPQPPASGWIAPAKYKPLANPYPVNSESQQLGSSLYSQHCKSCHGGKGEGNGPKSVNIETKIRSFLSAGFKAQTAGEVYYKSVFGKGDMPKFEKKIPDEEERWAIVHYIMSLK